MVEGTGRRVVGRNILANALGGAWVIALSLVAIPFQVRILGPEAFGLLGFLASLQMFLTVLDFGLSTTVNREIAADTTPGRSFSRDLVQTASGVYWAIAVLLGVGLAAAAWPISAQWLQLEQMTPLYAAAAIRVMAIWLALTWPTALYTSVLVGVQRLDIVNVLRVVTVTISQGGGVVVLLLWRDLEVFLFWMAGVALFSVILYAVACRKISPWMSLSLRPSLAVVRRVWRFSLDVNLITILAILYTQLDRLVIGRVLPLRMLGFYNVAYSLTKGVGTVQSFLNSALLPALSSDFARGQQDTMRARYGKFSQALVYLTVLPGLVLFFYAREVVGLWAGVEAAEAASPAAQILAVGFVLSAAMSAPYTLAVATAHTRLPLLVNALGIVFYVPALWFLVQQWGLEGAAAAWLGLNVYYVLLLLPMVEARILGSQPLHWIGKNLAPFLAAGLGLFWMGRWLIRGVMGDTAVASLVACLASTVAYAIAGYLLLTPSLRKDFRSVPALASSLLRRDAVTRPGS